MKKSLYKLFKKIAFNFDPEFVHDFSMRISGSYPFFSDILTYPERFKTDKYSITVGSKRWSFPVGLAAGMDKHCQSTEFFYNIGMGAVEVGTVTPLPQPGNDRPRLFRYPAEESIRNCMGFNNSGAAKLKEEIRLLRRENGQILGVNLGKNKITPSDLAADDYLKLYQTFAKVADYLVINLSSPNTPGLRDLQSIDQMREIFNNLGECRKTAPVDLYVKIAPDLDLNDVADICQLADEFKLTGIIATNTTIIESLGKGGVSGRLVRERSKIIREAVLNEVRGSSLEVIGVGGISTFNDVVEFWKCGGKVVQLLTSLIFNGPYMLEEIRSEIDYVMDSRGIKSVDELIKNIDNLDL